MQFSIIEKDSKLNLRVALNEEERFDVPVGGLKSPCYTFNLVDGWKSVNHYISTELTEEDAETLFITLRDTVDMMHYTEFTMARKQIRRAIRTIGTVIKPKHFMAKFHAYNFYDAPSSLKNFLEEGDTPELTYLRQDYIELLGLSDVFKFLLPIWLCALDNYSTEIGTKWQEVKIFYFITTSEFENLPQLNRLREYINATITVDVAKQKGAILKGLGTGEESVDLWLARSVMRKLVMFNAEMEELNIIRSISNYAKNGQANIDRHIAGNEYIATKDAPNERDGQDNNSIEEEKRFATEDTPVGRAALRYYSTLHEQILMQLGIGTEYLELHAACLDHVMSCTPSVYTFRKQIIASIMVRGIKDSNSLITPAHLDNTDDEVIWRLMAVVMTVLFVEALQKGDESRIWLAGLLTAKNRKANMMAIGSCTIPFNISNDHYDILHELYYHNNPKGMRTKVAKRNNRGYRTLSAMFDEINSHGEWVVNIPKDVFTTDGTEFSGTIPRNINLGETMVNLTLETTL